VYLPCGACKCAQNACVRAYACVARVVRVLPLACRESGCRERRCRSQPWVSPGDCAESAATQRELFRATSQRLCSWCLRREPPGWAWAGGFLLGYLGRRRCMATRTSGIRVRASRVTPWMQPWKRRATIREHEQRLWHRGAEHCCCCRRRQSRQLTTGRTARAPVGLGTSGRRGAGYRVQGGTSGRPRASRPASRWRPCRGTRPSKRRPEWAGRTTRLRGGGPSSYHPGGFARPR